LPGKHGACRSLKNLTLDFFKNRLFFSKNGLFFFAGKARLIFRQLALGLFGVQELGSYLSSLRSKVTRGRLQTIDYSKSVNRL
jgi:hypothetical protein